MYHYYHLLYDNGVHNPCTSTRYTLHISDSCANNIQKCNGSYDDLIMVFDTNNATHCTQYTPQTQIEIAIYFQISVILFVYVVFG